MFSYSVIMILFNHSLLAPPKVVKELSAWFYQMSKSANATFPQIV